MEAGSRLGPYEIVAPLGAGGMGEVYRARDTRLDRTVAVKVLPSHVASNPEVRQRFEREARAVSSLNHPNICTLHDVGHQDGVDYLVMEHLEGETLAQRIARGPLPIEDLLRCGVEIADALDRAHRSGIVHRDLKPGNVMLTKSGTKLLDFGLAKSMGQASAPSNLTASPTMTSPLTAEGAIVGTFQYMSPEQLEGSEADARSDIFALGAVIYEMATGRRAFEGKTQASLIASILKETPRPISEIAPVSPPALDRVVRQCLAKDPDERWQSAGDLKRELRWIAEGGSQAGAPAPAPAVAGRRGAWAMWAAAPILAGAMLALGYFLHGPAPAAAVMRMSLTLPPGVTLDLTNSSLALSPDGTRLAFTAEGPGGKQQIWVRPIDSLTAQPLAGTESATYPFWSPDGHYLGFFADRKLKKIQASGGTAVALCDAGDGRGASWGARGTIVFAPLPYGPLMQVAASGGAAAPLTTVDKDSRTHRNPHFLPDGRHVLFVSATNPGDKENGIYSLDVDSKETALVASEDSEGIYAEPGYMIFVRDGNLMAQPMDARAVRTTGEAVPIAEKIQFNSRRWTGAYSVSGGGLLLYQTGTSFTKRQLTWFDREGKKLSTVGETAPFTGVVLAPGDRRAVTGVRSPEGGFDLWIYDLLRGVGSRFTFGPASVGFPAWSPDGRQVAYGDGAGAFFVKAADGSSEPRTVLSQAGAARANSWSPDGSRLAYSIQSGKSGWDVWIVPMTGEPRPAPFISTASNERAAAFSPDGKWLSYVSDESGRDELFVVPFPGPGGKWQISSGGAVSGAWLGDGHEIAYSTPDNRLISVAVTVSGSNLDIGASRPLFGGNPLPQGPRAVAADGQRILVAVPLEEAVVPPLTLVVNWAEELARK